MTHFLFYSSAKYNEKIFFCRNDVEARASVRTPSYAPVFHPLDVRSRYPVRCD